MSEVVPPVEPTLHPDPPFKDHTGWQKVGECLVATSEAERKAYFQPFDYQDTAGRKRKACGAPRRRCPNCGHRYLAQFRLCLTCPACGLDRRCRRSAMVAKTRCEYHGAKQLRGPAHGKWKNGRSSLLWGDKLPDGPRQAFQRALKEMDTRNVFVEMATYHARIEQLSGRIAKASDSDAWWVRLGQLEKRARNAAAAKDQMDLDAAMNEMMKLARRGAHEAEQWRELLSCVKDLASLKQLQGQIERDQKAYLSMSDAMSIVTTMAQSMKEAFVLIRDNWRAIDVLLGDDDLLRDILVLLEGEGSEAAMERLRNQIPRIEMSEAFNTADRLVQERLSKLLV